MIKMDYSPEEICEWFGEDVLSGPKGVNIDKHILQILKDVETIQYNRRTEINREISSLEVRVKDMEKGLPDNYNGAEWEYIDINSKYTEKAKIEEINGYIKKGEEIKENYDQTVADIGVKFDNERKNIEFKYKELESDSNDIIALAEGKIEKAKKVIEGSKESIQLEFSKLDNCLESEIQKLKSDYEAKKSAVKKEIESSVEESKDLINIQENKITAKRTEISGLSEQKKLEIKTVDEKEKSAVDIEKERLGKAAKYLENNEFVDTEGLQAEIDNISKMKSYLRDWDRIQDIRNGELRKKQDESDHLTSLIDIARLKPSELLQMHELPIDGISVDENGKIRINGTLLDGLSDGEKLEAAFKIALQRIGELRVVCLDGFEKLDEKEQRKVVEFIEENDVQAFITVTKDTESGEFEIKNTI